MTWQQLEQELQLLTQKLSNFSPDIIVGIVRGGMIPARLLSTYLDIKTVYCLNVQKQNDGRKVTVEITDDVTNKKILLVEDMLETGKSLIVAKEYLENKGAVVKTACLYTMPTSEFKPDYFLKEIDKSVHFPWE